MNRLATSCWLGATLVAAPLSAAASQETAAANVCRAIAGIAAAARERPAFGSLRRAVAGGPSVVPGFEAGECTVIAEGVACRGRGPRSSFHGWPDLATCRGVVAYEPPLPRPQIRWPSNRSYRPRDTRP